MNRKYNQWRKRIWIWKTIVKSQKVWKCSWCFSSELVIRSVIIAMPISRFESSFSFNYRFHIRCLFSLNPLIRCTNVKKPKLKTLLLFFSHFLVFSILIIYIFCSHVFYWHLVGMLVYLLTHILWNIFFLFYTKLLLHLLFCKKPAHVLTREAGKLNWNVTGKNVSVEWENKRETLRSRNEVKVFSFSLKVNSTKTLILLDLN